MPYLNPVSITRVSFALLLALLLPASSTFAANQTRQADDIEALKRQLKDLQARVERLEQQEENGSSFDVATETEPVRGGWRKAHNWNLLEEGMTNYQVKAILGEPDRRKTVKKFEFLYYGDGKVSVYLRRLKSWDIPSGIDSD